MFGQRQAVDHVAGFDRFDRHAFGRGGGLQAIGAERKRFSERVDELVHLRHPVPVVQATLELVAEQVAQRLPGANAFEQAHGGAHALRREVDRQRVVRVCGRRGDVAVAQDGRRHGLIERRCVHEALVPRVSNERRAASIREFRRQVGVVKGHGR